MLDLRLDSPGWAAPIHVVVIGGAPGDLAVLRSVAAPPDFALAVVDAGGLGTTASTLAAAIRAARPDAIVVDAKQPGGDGYLLCRQLRATSALDGVPLLLMGSHDANDAHRAAYAAGCDEYLEKPISRSHLGFRLRAIARLRRAWAYQGPTGRMLAALTSLVRVQHPDRVPTRSRLTEWCAGFGSHLGLATDDRLALTHAAALHDLGEHGVPDDLIIGARTLSHDDRAILFRHAEASAAVVEPLDGAVALTAILRCHHERCDGRGYPDGLHDDQIPRLARVFRVLDVHDALLRTRPDQLDAPRAATAAQVRTDSARAGLDPALASAFRAWLALAG